jgi:hypothetical protein
MEELLGPEIVGQRQYKSNVVESSKPKVNNELMENLDCVIPLAPIHSKR